jgi:hypothetical protein
MTQPPAEATHVALGDRALPQTLAEIEAAIGRAVDGEALDLTTTHEVIVKYVVPTAAVRGVRASFRRDPDLGWRVALRPRAVRTGDE